MLLLFILWFKIIALWQYLFELTCTIIVLIICVSVASDSGNKQ